MSLMQAKRVGQMAAGSLLLLLLLAPASAQQQPTQAQRDAIKQSCRSDFMSHCSGVQPGGKEALDCLKSNGPQLSPNCRAAVDAIQPGQKPAGSRPGNPRRKPQRRRPDRRLPVRARCRWLLLLRPRWFR